MITDEIDTLEVSIKSMKEQWELEKNGLQIVRDKKDELKKWKPNAMTCLFPAVI